MTVSTIQYTPTHPTPLPVLQFCSGWRHTLFTRTMWGSRGHSHFPFAKLNFMSHSDQSQWQGKAAACWYITTPPQPPPTHHPPLALSLIPRLPTSHSAAFWMQIEPHWGRKRLKGAMFLSSIKQMFATRAEKIQFVLFKQQYLYFWRKETLAGTTHRQADRQLQDDGTEDRRRKCPWTVAVQSLFSTNWCKYT